MADQSQQKTSSFNASEAVARATGAAKSLATAVKAAGRAAAGDVAGAVMDVIKDPQLIKGIISTVVAVCLLVAFIFFAVGTALVEMIQMFLTEWKEHYMEILTEDAIKNGGSYLQLLTDMQLAGYEATWDSIIGFFEDEDKHEGGTVFGKPDYQTTMDAVIDEEAFAGANGAIMKRVRLIKNRVKERGDQIRDALWQYEWDAACIKVALSICEKANNPFLYNGINNVATNVDTSCFHLTDVQCIKILAAYCAQKECNVQNADIWELMNYLGWYSLGSSDTAMRDSIDTGTIYDTPLIGRFVEDFYGSFSAGTVVGAGDTSSIELSPPKIPVWMGTFSPQYLFEEKIQLEKMEKEGKIVLPRDALGNVKWEECSSKYEYDGGLGLIDYLFTGAAFASFSRTNYTGIDAPIDEFLAEMTSNGLDKIADLWKELWGEDTSNVTTITVTKPGVNNKCTVTQTIYSDGSPSTYSVVTNKSVKVFFPSTIIFATADGNTHLPITGYTPIGDTGGYLYLVEGLQPNTEYEIYIRQPDPDVEGFTELVWVDSFTTAFDTEDGSVYQAYKIDISVDITYRARSLDELAFDIIGLWPGELSDVEETSPGSFRATGHTNNPLMKRDWHDSITDANGITHSYQFTRLRGNQYEYYIDYIKGLANTLPNIDITGAFAPEFTSADTILSVATKEYEYYNHNKMVGGDRYWDICSSVTRESYQTERENGTDWSALFVLCCAHQCGLIGKGNTFGDFGCDARIWPVNCAAFYNAMREHSSAVRHEEDSYRPVTGDLVFFSSMGAGSRTPDQVGIVVGVTANNKLVTIEGGSHDAVQRCTYSNYKVGSPAYGSGQNTRYISSYISPRYDISRTYGKQYLENHSILGNLQSNAMQIHINSAPTTTIIVGAGRFRLSQLIDVLDEFERMYPHFINMKYPDLRHAVVTAKLHQDKNCLTVDDISDVAVQWQLFGMSVGYDMPQVLSDIASRTYINPVAAQIKTATGFDWNKTVLRREILWQIVTSTDQHHIARQVLNTCVAGETNNLTDEDLLRLLMSPAQITTEDGTVATSQLSLLTYVLEKNRVALWPEDHSKLQDAWISCAEKNMNVLRDKWLNGTLK